MSPDGPLGIALGTTTLTKQRWGSIPRTHITCTQDTALRPKVHQTFVAEADVAFPGNPTSVVTLDASHSPMLSMPFRVANIVAKLG